MDDWVVESHDTRHALCRPTTSLTDFRDQSVLDEGSSREGTADVSIFFLASALSLCICMSIVTRRVQPAADGGDDERPETEASNSSQKRSFKPKKTFDFDNGDSALSEVWPSRSALRAILRTIRIT